MRTKGPADLYCPRDAALRHRQNRISSRPIGTRSAENTQKNENTTAMTANDGDHHGALNRKSVQEFACELSRVHTGKAISEIKLRTAQIPWLIRLGRRSRQLPARAVSGCPAHAGLSNQSDIAMQIRMNGMVLWAQCAGRRRSPFVAELRATFPSRRR